jgi:ABC-2 type transport system permease protein
MSISTYTPTLMEKLLGKNYKWWYTTMYFLRLRTTYRVDNFLFALGNVITLFGTILTWWVALDRQFSNEFSERVTYFVIGTLFFSIINTWPTFFGYDIKRGGHTSLLLKPSSLFGQVYARYTGLAIFQNSNMALIIILILPFLNSIIDFTFTLESLLLSVLLSMVSAIIYFFAQLMIGLCAFFITEINGLTLNWGFVASILMGKLFPLNLLISSFTVLLFNPLAYAFYHPMQIYLGNYNTQQIIYTFLGGIAWCLVLYFLAKFIFKLGLKKNESVGL